MSSTGRGKRKTRDNGSGWSEWGGYMNAKIQKLRNQYVEDGSEGAGNKGSASQIFKGVAIFVNGYTKPTSDVLKKLMQQHGGVFHHYYSRAHVTHIVASNLPNSKIKQFMEKKVVKPEWITDSITAGRLLPYTTYLLLTNQSKIQQGLKVTSISRPSVSNEPGVSELAPDKAGEVNEDEVQMEIPDSEMDDIQDTSEVEYMQVEKSKADVALSTNSDNVSKGNKGSHPETTEKPVPNTVPSEQSPSGKFRAPSKAGDANFVSEFYNNSRLHYLSTWGAEFRAYVNELHAKGGNVFPGRQKLIQMVASKTTEVQDLGTSAGSAKGFGVSGKPERAIMHVDMDSFFVSVGLRNRPDLVGKPIAVTHSRGKGIVKDRQGTNFEQEKAHWQRRGLKLRKGPGKGKLDPEQNPDLQKMNLDVLDEEEGEEEDKDNRKQEKEAFHSMAEIASCSYEARQAGVKNGMFMGRARQLCPDLVTIPYDFEGYREVAQNLYDIMSSYTHDIEAVSCDEMFVDLTDLLADTGVTALEFATVVRQEIKEKTRCNASAGIGPNILMARLATRVAKPNGQFCIESYQVEDFMKDKSIKDLPGVGWAMTNKLAIMGVSTCGELQKVTLASLQKEFGPKTGQSLYRSCRGVDNRPIKVERERKSVSAEINYGIRFTEDKEVEKFLYELADEVHNRLEKAKVKGKTITLKLKVRKESAPRETAKFLGHGICDNVTKSVTVPLATDSAKQIGKECVAILKPLRIPASDLRGIGIAMSRLEGLVENQTGGPRGVQSILNFATSSARKIPEETSDRQTGNQANQEVQTAEKEAEPEPMSRNMVPDQQQREDIALPPLPTLPDFSSPDPSQEEQQEVVLQKSRNVNEPGDNDDIYLPSPSQVDPEVLKALPPEIRKSIEAALRAKESKKMSRSKPVRRSSRVKSSDRQPAGGSSVQAHSGSHRGEVKEARPGCSHWSSQGSTNKTDGEEEMESEDIIEIDTDSKMESHRPSEPIVPLPSMSQIDPSCLAALPEDLQAELKSAYAREQETGDHAQSGTVRPMMLRQATRTSSPGKKSPQKSPQKGKSPMKRGKKSPVFKVPKTRPNKRNNVSHRKLDFGRQPKVTPTTNQQIEGVPQQTVEKNEATIAPKKENINRVNLCGAVSIEEVKTLLEEWLNSCAAPEDDDLERFCHYLQELVEDKNLEMVDLLIKFLCRRIERRGLSVWLDRLVALITQLQVFILAQHGAELKLPASLSVRVHLKL